MTDVDRDFEELLEYLRDNRGFDFTGYKRASVMRRVRKRMSEVAIDDFAGYQDYREVNPDEFTALFNTILINVTSFFRDPESWEFVAQDVLPRIVEGKGRGPLRTWSVGCASGEETYTLAMMIAEAVGLDRMRGTRQDLRDGRRRGGPRAGTPRGLYGIRGRVDSVRAFARSTSCSPTVASSFARSSGVLSSSAVTTSSRMPRSRVSI